MKIFKQISFAFGLLSFWITIFLVLPVLAYMSIWGVSGFRFLDMIGFDLFDYGTLAWAVQQICYESAPLVSIAIAILVLLFSYELWRKSYRKWKTILLSLLIPIGLLVTIILATGHYEVTSFFIPHHSINLEKDFVLSGYQENIPDQQNGYYRQNQWLIENSGLLLSGAKLDKNKLISDLSGIVHLSYSKTKYKDPLFPLEARKGKAWTTYILDQRDPQLDILRYQFVRQRMESFVPMIEFLVSNVLQTQMFDTRKQELQTMPTPEKIQLLSILTPYNTTGIYDEMMLREYHSTIYYTTDLPINNGMKLPTFLLDKEETKWLAGMYFNEARKNDTMQLNDSDFGISWKENYLGYNMLGIRALQALLPRLTGMSNRLINLEKQRQVLIQNIQNSL